MNKNIQLNSSLEHSMNLSLDKKVSLVQEILLTMGAKFSHFGTVQLPGITMSTPRLFVDKNVKGLLSDYNSVEFIENYLGCEVVFVNSL